MSEPIEIFKLLQSDDWRDKSYVVIFCHNTTNKKQWTVCHVKSREERNCLNGTYARYLLSTTDERFDTREDAAVAAQRANEKAYNDWVSFMGALD